MNRFLLVFVLFPLFIFAQSKTINGTINDENGSPLPGATVQLKGSDTMSELKEKIKALEEAAKTTLGQDHLLYQSQPEQSRESQSPRQLPFRNNHNHRKIAESFEASCKRCDVRASTAWPFAGKQLATPHAMHCRRSRPNSGL